MTDSPAAATSKTEVPGLYVPPAAARSARLSSAQAASAVAAEALLKLTRAPAARLDQRTTSEERTLSNEPFTELRRASRVYTPKPVLWVDGPIDLALTAYVLCSRGKTSSVKENRIDELITSEWGKERLTKAHELVAQLPKELLATAKGQSLRIQNEGVLTRFILQRATAVQTQLDSNVASFAASAKTRGRNGALGPLIERYATMNAVGGLLANAGAIPLTMNSDRWGGSSERIDWDKRRSLVASAGEERADLLTAVALLVKALRVHGRGASRSVASDAHEVFTFKNVPELAHLQYLHALARETIYGHNYHDESLTWAEEFVFGTTGHVPFTTFDLVARAPSRIVEQGASLLSIDNVDQLLSQPTVEWADGTSFTLYDGLELPAAITKKVVKKPSELLTVRNAEQRRALLRLIGHKRLLEDVKAKEVMTDDFGTLYALPNNAQFVIVKNATPEPDGSIREYVLGAVGNSHKTARSAVASTWGLTEANYYPIRET